MKFSDILTPKKNKPKNTTNKTPYSVFMGRIFILCAIVQGVLFTSIKKTYGLPEKNTWLDSCALLVVFTCLIAGLVCIADNLYKTNKKLSIMLLIGSFMTLFLVIIFTIISFIEVFHG